jgi:hypothetical protein
MTNEQNNILITGLARIAVYISAVAERNTPITDNEVAVFNRSIFDTLIGIRFIDASVDTESAKKIISDSVSDFLETLLIDKAIGLAQLTNQIGFVDPALKPVTVEFVQNYITDKNDQVDSARATMLQLLGAV